MSGLFRLLTGRAGDTCTTMILLVPGPTPLFLVSHRPPRTISPPPTFMIFCARTGFLPLPRAAIVAVWRCAIRISPDRHARYSLVLHVILSPTDIGNLTYYVPVMDAGDDLAA